MDDDDSADVTADMFRALCIALFRAGKIDMDDIGEAADALASEGKDMAAHELRCIALRGSLAPEREQMAHHRRSQIRVVSDGPKEDE